MASRQAGVLAAGSNSAHSQGGWQGDKEVSAGGEARQKSCRCCSLTNAEAHTRPPVRGHMHVRRCACGARAKGGCVVGRAHTAAHEPAQSWA